MKTPSVDRLAAEGVAFQKAFVTTAICCVSRASFLTGLYARHHKVGDFGTPLPDEILAQSYPARFKAAGYRTGCLGKWGIGGPPPTDLFDVWNATGGQGTYFETVNGERVHNSEILARRAEDFLRTCPDDQPFCLLVYYKSPHEPFQPDPADLPLFANDTFTPPKTATEAHFQAMPEFIRRSEGRTRRDKRHPTADAYQEFVRTYFRLIAGVDRSVGKILDTLDEQGMTDNTIVVYTSDHGFFLDEHGLSGKWLMHEESIRIPLVIRDPRLPKERRGSQPEQLVLNIDLAPTVLDLAGLPIPEETDGRSLKPLMYGEPVDWRDDFFYEHHFDYGGRIPKTEGVRTADWKYITYPGTEPRYEELYNLEKDPFEEQNLADDPASQERLKSMRERYRSYVDQIPPPVLPSPPPPRRNNP